jgi:hypothetical protein
VTCVEDLARSPIPTKLKNLNQPLPTSGATQSKEKRQDINEALPQRHQTIRAEIKPSSQQEKPSHPLPLDIITLQLLAEHTRVHQELHHLPTKIAASILLQQLSNSSPPAPSSSFIAALPVSMITMQPPFRKLGAFESLAILHQLSLRQHQSGKTHSSSSLRMYSLGQTTSTVLTEFERQQRKAAQLPSSIVEHIPLNHLVTRSMPKRPYLASPSYWRRHRNNPQTTSIAVEHPIDRICSSSQRITSNDRFVSPIENKTTIEKKLDISRDCSRPPSRSKRSVPPGPEIPLSAPSPRTSLLQGANKSAHPVGDERSPMELKFKRPRRCKNNHDDT